MIHEGDDSGFIDRFTSFAMDRVSRRGFLKGVGSTGLALLGILGIGSRIAEASVQYPPDTYGNCSHCYSECHYASSGDTFQCLCVGCNCTPPQVEAYCHWQFQYPRTCLKTGACLEC